MAHGSQIELSLLGIWPLPTYRLSIASTNAHNSFLFMLLRTERLRLCSLKLAKDIEVIKDNGLKEMKTQVDLGSNFYVQAKM